MRLILDRTLFEVKSKAEAMSLMDLLTTVARDFRHHALLTDPPYIPGGNNGPIDIWLARRESEESDVFRDVLNNGLLFNASRPLAGSVSDAKQPRRWHLEGLLTVRVERRHASDWQGRVLTVADAADLVREPVHLVLENARTELAFVRLLASPTVGNALQTLIDQPGRIAVHGGGGAGEAKKWLEALTERSPTPAIWRRMLRAWVLCDSDSGDLDARTLSRPANLLIEACERVLSILGRGLSWVCLLRRELESYAPDSALRAEALNTQVSFAQQVISWRADPLRSHWAWALDLKTGLRGDLLPGLSKDERQKLQDRSVPLEARMLKAPFAGLSAPEIGILDSGFGDRLGKALRATPDRPWASDLPAEYDRGPADQAPRLSFVQSLFDRM